MTDISSETNAAAHDVAYVWDMVSDAIVWENDKIAAGVLGLTDTPPPTTGADLKALISAEHISRHELGTSRSREADLGSGVTYRLDYTIKPFGLRTARAVYVEDSGRWWAGPNGRPARARGTLRCVQIAEKPTDAIPIVAASDYDELTGLLNRQRLSDALGAVIERTIHSEEPAAALMISVNNLERINDTLGFEVGDTVLRRVAQRLKSVTRGGDTLSRYSSNKFCLVLRECQMDEIRPAARRLIKSVSSDPINNNGTLLSATLSMGAVALPAHATNTDQCYGRLLRALQTARRGAKTLSIYNPDDVIELRRVEYGRVAEQLGKALSDNRLQLALQPIVASGSRQPAFYECLLRIREPNDAMLSAGTFVPIAEELGLASLIDRETLRQGIDLLRRSPELKLSLNVSALTCNDHQWMRDLYEACSETPDIAPRLIIEITETAATQNLDETAHFADSVCELGSQIAIDDFGAGYTSFACLKRLPAQILKVDGIFARNLVADSADQILMKSILGLGRDFGMQTVVEWVADEPTARWAENLGADYLQGFHCGVPKPADEVLAELGAPIAV